MTDDGLRPVRACLDDLAPVLRDGRELALLLDGETLENAADRAADDLDEAFGSGTVDQS